MVSNKLRVKLPLPTATAAVVVAVLAIRLLAPAAAIDLGAVSASSFETLTFSVRNVSFEGNPFDLDATVLFTHDESNKQIRTGMYYDGDDTWRFRFNGSLPGKWTFYSDSADGELSNVFGEVDVQHAEVANGFLTSYGSKYARQAGDADTLKAQPYVVYMNLRSEGESQNPGFGSFDDLVGDWGGASNASKRLAYINQAKAHGANAVFLPVNNQWFQNGALGWNEHSSTDPDRAVFSAIEDLVSDAHREGVQVHIWAWGDDANHRRWTPVGVDGGINGPADRRVQRYIADRLGPLPGWTMGYGFDLFEWASQGQVSEWANFLTDRMGWDHLLAARGLPLLGADGLESSAPPTFLDSYASFRRPFQILQTDSNDVSSADDGGPDSYPEAYEDIQNDLARPVIYEERHTYQREWHRTAWPTTNQDGTRRLLWWWTMAGGAGGWIGFYPTGNQGLGVGPYPQPEQFRTHAEFWRDRLQLDMQPDNSLTAGASQQQYAMRSPATGEIVVFAEATDAIQLQIEHLSENFHAVLIDAEAAYAEIDLGLIDSDQFVLDLSEYGRPRDWVLSLSPALSGDYNADGMVNIADYTVWRDNLGARFSLANETQTPGVVDLEDYLEWRSRYGERSGSADVDSSTSRVPEPAALWLLSCALALGVLWTPPYRRQYVFRCVSAVCERVASLGY